MNLRDALDRTLLLMRDEFGDAVHDRVLIEALTSTRVALIADGPNIASHAAQCAFVTAAMLMARSGHQVYLLVPNVPLLGPQPPLAPGEMLDGLLRVGTDMLPGVEFVPGDPRMSVDLAVALGDSPIKVSASRRIRVNAHAWAGVLASENHNERWNSHIWPMGAFAAAALAAGEAFKIAMHKLLPLALNPAATADVFAETDDSIFTFAPPDTPFVSDLGGFDCVSGGAIIDAALYVLARIPAARGGGRIIEPDRYGLSNLNRYMMMLRLKDGLPKAQELAGSLNCGLTFEPIIERFDPDLLHSIGPLRPRVLVGVDDIPARWSVQQAWPEFLAIGATTHWSAMASFHEAGLGCAQCLHPEDDHGSAPIPTTACVSFWAGLLAATYLVRHAAGMNIPVHEQQTYLTPFRPENPFKAAVPVRDNCPSCQPRSGPLYRRLAE